MFYVDIFFWQGIESTEEQVLIVSFSLLPPWSNAKPHSLLEWAYFSWVRKTLPDFWSLFTSHVSNDKPQIYVKFNNPSQIYIFKW